MANTGSRITYLDGLRGLAISTVFAYHLYGLGPAAITPYHDSYAKNPVVEFGWMGVELFFLISGYVIFLTVERCTGFTNFIYRRWMRLFPVMLMASTLIFILDKSFNLPGRFSDPKALDILPGILFISPAVIHAITRMELASLDDTFWSLYVEVTFYIVFGLAYFSVGWKRAVAFLILCSGVYSLLSIGFGGRPLIASLIKPLQWLGVPYFVWFASGALFYKADVELSAWTRFAAIATGLVAATIYDGPFMNVQKHLVLCGLVLLFAISQSSPLLRQVLAAPPLLFVGYVSYALYLIHSNLAVGITTEVSSWGVNALLASASAVLVVVILALVITRIEPWLRRQLLSGLERVRNGFIRSCAS